MAEIVSNDLITGLQAEVIRREERIVADEAGSDRIENRLNLVKA